MYPNYRAWNVSIDDFPKSGTIEQKIVYLLSFAVLAPSSHNSQPWKFEVANNSVRIFFNDERLLPVSDSSGRERWMSLGCAVENFVIAGLHFGITAGITIPSDGTESGAAVEIICSDNKEPSQNTADDLLRAIPIRCTNRGPYAEGGIEKEIINMITGFAATYGCAVNIVTKKEDIHSLTDIALDAGVAAMDNSRFRKELAPYVSSNITLRKLGIPLFGKGIPLIPSLIAPYLLRFINLNRASRPKDEIIFKHHTPAMLVFSSHDEPKSWLAVGRCVERIALESVDKGYAIHPYAAPIEIDGFYQKIQRLLGMDKRPQFFCRYGRKTRETRHSPRKLAKECLVLA